AGGTLVLAVATFASVRSANASARVAERALQINLRPVLAPTRYEDPVQKVMFIDQQWVHLKGGRGAVEFREGNIYLAMGLRNVGSGIAVLRAWKSYPARPDTEPGELLESFRPLTRALWVPPGDIGFWQGAIRDEDDAEHAELRRAIADRSPLTVDLLYGDHEGGQPAVSRFSLTPRDSDDWWAAVSQHRNLSGHGLPPPNGAGRAGRS
ncbi:MAG: hypothetical protein ACRDZY_13255, partial [Acidimicrobiales bacterium]